MELIAGCYRYRSGSSRRIDDDDTLLVDGIGSNASSDGVSSLICTNDGLRLFLTDYENNAVRRIGFWTCCHDTVMSGQW